MTTPGQLIEVVHRATGVALATIVDIDRKLVQGGLRTKAGRGLNAARMTPLDAARLLTALVASPQSNTVVAAVERYGATRCDGAICDLDHGRGIWIEALTSLPKDHSFVDALAALLSAAPIGAVGNAHGPRIELSAMTWETQGRLHVSDLPKDITVDLIYVPRSIIKRGSVRRDPGRSGAGLDGDLVQWRRISERTILAIAGCLNI